MVSSGRRIKMKIFLSILIMIVPVCLILSAIAYIIDDFMCYGFDFIRLMLLIALVSLLIFTVATTFYLLFLV